MSEEQQTQFRKEEVSEKDNMITLVLALFFGGLGAHRFYAGRMKSATIMLLITSFILAIWCIPSSLKESAQGLKALILFILFIISVMLKLFLGIWILSDIIMIFLGKFKDKEGKVIK